jgi:hypothetical protein
MTLWGQRLHSLVTTSRSYFIYWVKYPINEILRPIQTIAMELLEVPMKLSLGFIKYILNIFYKTTIVYFDCKMYTLVI